MDDAVEVARLLDILGNRNRRRIIELLRQKPCFVTEISDTLILSPKAVIDHLQMMEREAILSSQVDERRRKYYYRANDILIDVSLKEVRILSTGEPEDDEAGERLKNAVTMLGRMIHAHDRILENLEQINHDIEIKTWIEISIIIKLRSPQPKLLQPLVPRPVYHSSMLLTIEKATL